MKKILFSAIFFCVSIMYGMNETLSAGSVIMPLTCQLDEELFDSLTARLASLNAAGEKKLLTSTPLYSAASVLKSTISGYSSHRTILIGSDAVRLLFDALTSFYAQEELQLGFAQECTSRQKLLSKWDILAQSQIVDQLQSKTSLMCYGLFDSPELFFIANSSLSSGEAKKLIEAAILGIYYLKQMNRMRVHTFCKTGLIDLPNENF
jgi:hypothetical protein